MKAQLEQILKDFFYHTWGGKPSQRTLSEGFEIFSNHLIVNSPLGYSKGTDTLKLNMSSWFEAFPDVIANIGEIHHYKDSIVCKWGAKGTHQALFQDLEPTGKTFFTQGELALVFDQSSQVVHYMAKVDMGDIFHQLGENTIKEEPSSQNRLHSNLRLLIHELITHYIRLTHREIECASLCISGFSAKQIGIMLSLSHRTVEDYLEKARSSLNCNNKIQVIEKLLAEQTFFLFQDCARLLVIQHASKLQTSG